MPILPSAAHAALHRAWRHGQMVPFLGAGVSFDYGLPAWQHLVLELLFEEVADGSPLRQLAINYRRAVSDWLADYLDYGPVVLARLIEDHVTGYAQTTEARKQARANFLKSIQRTLYANFVRPPRPTAITAIADLVEKDPARIPVIVTYNFDDLLEQELTRRGIRCQSVYATSRVDHGALPVIHAHGFIPQHGKPPEAEIVFTERDYHALTEGVFHWALTEVVWNLRHRTVLFAGLSMSDPSLRRLLDASLIAGEPGHYQLQKRHEIAPERQWAVLEEFDASARSWGEKFGRPFAKRPPELFDVLNTTLRQADDFDRQLFHRMGVETLWLDSFAEIPLAISEIAKPRPLRRRT